MTTSRFENTPVRRPARPTALLCALALTTALTAALVTGCAGGMGGMGGAATPAMPWNQELATKAATTYASNMANTYSTAYKMPQFAGERSAYGETLDTLRQLKEEAGGLQAELAAGKDRAQTATRFERIQELTRDADESEAWEFLPEDFATSAKSSLATINVLKGYYGTP